ncbi:MAG: universal stress protein, partial [Gemmatimonadetes bacterium]|nr:universal stress protein [Gemmatimonadota bacterium]
MTHRWTILSLIACSCATLARPALSQQVPYPIPDLPEAVERESPVETGIFTTREVQRPETAFLTDRAVDRAIEICRRSGGRITANHVYAARLHDVRFRQLETGLPAQFQSPEEIRRQRRIHDKLIEKGLQLISDSFLDQVEKRCGQAEVPVTRQLLEGINYEELIRETNRGAGQLPSLIGFDPNIADKYDGGEKVRGDVALGEDGRIVAEDEDPDEKTAGSSGRAYDLLAIGAHGLGRQPYSQLGGVVSRVIRGVEKDVLIVRDEKPLEGGSYMVCVDGSAYSYKAMRVALELAREFGATLYVCSAFDVEYHHVVFHNIKDVLSVQASKVFKFEEQEELHNNIIDKGLLKLCQANIKRAEVMAEEFPDVEVETQILIGKPFQVVLQWAEEVEPSLLVFARHGSHRIEGTAMGSQAENLVRLAPANTLLIGTTEVHPEEIPWIEEDGESGLEWAPDAEVRILRVPPFALGIARKAVEEFVLERYGTGGNGTNVEDGRVEDGHTRDGHSEPPVVTGERLDEAIQKLLPTHMQLVMGIGTAEELALAEVKAEEAMKRTVVEGIDGDPAPGARTVEAKCPYTGHVTTREWTPKDDVVWTAEAFERLKQVPLIARPLARNTVERFAREHGVWRVSTRVMDENKQSMIEADTFDAETMLVMFKELQTKQLRAAAEGVDGLTPEMRRFIEEAKASGVTRCPIRDLEAASEKCPVDFKVASPAEAKAAVEAFIAGRGGEGEDESEPGGGATA